MNDWTIRDDDTGKEWYADSRREAERRVDEFPTRDLKIVPPGAKTDGGETVQPEVVDQTDKSEVSETPPEPSNYDLPERSVSDDPLDWVPGDFIDVIDGTQAINRKGFAVLCHFYGIDTDSDVQVAPEETDFEYCRVKATAYTEDGRSYEAHGSAHVDRGDDPYLLVEMADTRAKKRAQADATGVGAVAVSELKNEVMD